MNEHAAAVAALIAKEPFYCPYDYIHTTFEEYLNTMLEPRLNEKEFYIVKEWLTKCSDTSITL